MILHRDKHRFCPWRDQPEQQEHKRKPNAEVNPIGRLRSQFDDQRKKQNNPADPKN